MTNKIIYSLDKCSLKLQEKMILAPQSFSVMEGDFITISGRSGAGKTTLLQLLLGFVQPTSGRVLYKNSELNCHVVAKMRKEVAVVFQEPQLLGRSVNDAVLEPFTYKVNHKMEPSKNEILHVFKLLEVEVDLGSQLTTLSGGEKQRIALARALLMKREIIILDEVTSALDETHRALVFDVVKSCGATVIAVTHDSTWIERSPANIVISPSSESEV